jgi:hypothetical protein
MSGINGTVIDLDGQDVTPAGRDRRHAIALAFVMCLSVGGSVVGRDGPVATAPVEPPHLLILSRDTSDAVLFAFPDRLANEPLPNLPYMTVVVRGTDGLAVNTGEVFVRDDIRWGRDPDLLPVQGWLVTWTEDGTAYSLRSDRRDLSDLLRIAGSLR